ncbi:MAG: hypothetical protein AB7P21_27740 [Lautropia sp.]
MGCSNPEHGDAPERTGVAAVEKDSSSMRSPSADPTESLAAAVAKTASKPASAPVMVDIATGDPIAGAPVPRLVTRPPVARSDGCVIDFTDQDALAQTISTLWYDRVRVPWTQRCGVGFATLRALFSDHLHVGFEHWMEVLPCSDPQDPAFEQAYPSRIADDGRCEHVDIRTEPRTYATTHDWWDGVVLRAYVDSSHWARFDLKQIRIAPPHSARVCYSRAEGSDGPWLTGTPSPATHPGIWHCWDRLHPGVWDLSDWVTDVDEVRLLSPRDDYNNISFDDLSVSLRWPN